MCKKYFIIYMHQRRNSNSKHVNSVQAPLSLPVMLLTSCSLTTTAIICKERGVFTENYGGEKGVALFLFHSKDVTCKFIGFCH